MSKSKPKTPGAHFSSISKAFSPKDVSWVPDWRRKSEYPSEDKTALEEFAWEFLRRNRHYQKAVEAEEIDWEKSTNWSSEWGIGSGKNYALSYSKLRSSRNSPPIWKVVNPMVIRSQAERKATATRKDPLTSLAHGQVAVLFDLNLCFTMPDLVDAQLRNLGVRLKRELEQHPVSQILTTKGAGTSLKKDLVTKLRVADAITAAKPPRRAEIGELLFKENLVLEGGDEDLILEGEFSSAVHRIIEAAYELIYGKRYLLLLT